MSKKYSIADARNNLARVVHEVEEEGAIELTRRGKSVAVLLSLEEYKRLHGPERSFWNAVQEFRRAYELEELQIDPDEVFGDVRERSPGRDFKW